MSSRHKAGGSIKIFLTLLFWLYRLLLMPVIKISLPLLAIFANKKMKSWVALRKSPIAYPPLTDRPIWIHAASGEIEHAKSLIKELKIKFPQKSILVTYSSISATKLFKNLDVSITIPLPLDEKKEVTKFLKHFNPLVVCIARSDLWPEVLYQCQQLKIPILFFAVAISRTQNRYWQKFLSSWIHVVSLCYEEDVKEAVDRFPLSEVVVDGDPRCEQILSRISNQEYAKFEFKKTLVLGSTWPEDEQVLIGGITDWLARGNRVIWAPHEVDEKHLSKLEKQILDFRYSSKRLGHFASWSDTQILIIDRIGVLLNFYPLAEFAFVGGSFKGKVHSVLEPLLSGCQVSVGPFHQNSKEAVLFQNKGVTTITKSSELADWLAGSFSTDLRAKELILKQNEMSSQKLVSRIAKLAGI